MQQHLIVGLGAFGAAALERVRALPLEHNVVYRQLEIPADKPVAAAYLEYRQQLLDLLNREVFNFANTPLNVHLVGLLVERHMAQNLMHLGYLFKSFFRENIILNPRVRLITALPTILPEEAYEWLPETRRTLERIDLFASLKEQFVPAYPDVKRPLPAISGPPFEEVVFVYSESLDEEDLGVSAQAAATKLYFDLVVFPARARERPELLQVARSLPAGQGFCPISGCAVAFLPGLAKLVRDELEYVLLMRLIERFLPDRPPDAGALDQQVEELLRGAHAVKPRDLLDDVVGHALAHERWFDLASLDASKHYDIEMSPPPEVYLSTWLANFERERSRFTGRLRDLAFERILGLPERLVASLREGQPGLDLQALDALYTRAFSRILQLVGQGAGLAQGLRGDWERARGEVTRRIAKLKELQAAGLKLKKGGEGETRVREVLSGVDARALLCAALLATVADALATDTTLEQRLREGYDPPHELFASFLRRRAELLAFLHHRRDGYVRRRELHLYVFNQVFRERILDAELSRSLAELKRQAPEQDLLRLVNAFFFKRWSAAPGLPLEEVERALLESIRLEAADTVERIAAQVRVDYSKVLGILREIAQGQADSIFDRKFKEHPQASFREAGFLFHKDETLATALTQKDPAGPGLSDVALVPELPYQLLQVVEIHGLPFRALRQYASLDRGAAASPEKPPPPM